MRPPTSGDTRTSVASTYPEARGVAAACDSCASRDVAANRRQSRRDIPNPFVISVVRLPTMIRIVIRGRNHVAVTRADHGVRCLPEQPQRDALHVRDDLVAVDRGRPLRARRARCGWRMPARRKKQQHRADDAGVDEQRVDRPECAGATHLPSMMAAEGRERRRPCLRASRRRGAGHPRRSRGTRSAGSAAAPRPRWRMASMKARIFSGGARLGGRDVADARADGAEHVAKNLAVELGLAAEVVVNHRLVQAGGGGDAVDAGAGKAVRGKGGGGGGEDTIAGAIRRRGRAALGGSPAAVTSRLTDGGY